MKHAQSDAQEDLGSRQRSRTEMARSPKCRRRVAADVLHEFERKMRTLGVDNYGCLQGGE